MNLWMLFSSWTEARNCFYVALFSWLLVIIVLFDVTFWCEMDNQATTPFGYCPIMAFFPVRPHCTNAKQNRCQEDLNSCLFGELVATTKTPSYYVDEDYPARPEIQYPVPEWSNWHSSELSTLETDVYIWRYALVVVLARNEWNLPCQSIIRSNTWSDKMIPLPWTVCSCDWLFSWVVCACIRVIVGAMPSS